METLAAFYRNRTTLLEIMNMPVSYIIALRELAKQKMKDEETKKQEQGMALGMKWRLISMDNVEFIKNIPAEKLAEIFRNYFEQHMAVYDILKGVEFVSLNNIDMDTASLIYSVKVLDEKSKDALVNKLKSTSGSLNMYGKLFTPDIFMNGDLLCITINK